ncbi:hypothetical protein BG000_000845 [Podila horticola]|nr:hypothetical protein BG000_000845 [Podila horticola]
MRFQAVIMTLALCLALSAEALGVVHVYSEQNFQGDGAIIPVELKSSTRHTLRLDDLTLGQVKFDNPDEAPRFLSNRPDLPKLELCDISSVAVFHGCRLLPKMDDLIFIFKWKKNAGLAQLLRCCPNLKVLDIHYDKYFPIADLARILREDCPKLHTNKCHAFKTYCRKR